MAKVELHFHGAHLGAVNGEGSLDTAMRLIGIAFCEDGEWGSKYGAKYENDVFLMKPDYQDEECTCGASARGEGWHEANPHALDCYSIELRRREDEYDETSGYNAAKAATSAPGMMEHKTEEIDFFGAPITCTQTSSWRTPAGEIAHKAWSKAYDAQRKAHRKIAKALCAERGIPWRNGYGSGVHCTCGVTEKAKAYFSGEGAHLPTCAFEIPNFWFKPTDLRVTWYKYIGRDMEANCETVDGDFLRQVFATHPRGMTIEQAVDALVAETNERRAALAAIIEHANSRNQSS